MTTTNKKKRAVTSFKKINKSEDMITQVDQQTYYHKRSKEPDKDPYMIFNSNSLGWLCDCMSFTMNIDDKGKSNCKHIDAIKKEFNIA
jgi:hypothetical protein